jgi:hypothetical protein
MFTTTVETNQTQLLQEAVNLSVAINDNPNSPQVNNQRKRLQDVVSQLQEFAQPIRHNFNREITKKISESLVLAMQYLPRYRQLTNQPIGGTLLSPTLSQYPTDPVPIQQQDTKILCQQFDLTISYVEVVEQKLAEVDNEITTHQRVMKALISHFNGLNTQEDTKALFNQLFGNVPIPASAIDCVTTNLQIAIAINHNNNQLRNKSLWDSLTPTQQNEVSAFLKQHSRFSFQQFYNFPIFSHLSPETINPTLLNQLILDTGLCLETILEVLHRSINIVPTQKAELYLVHDIQGHFWQLFFTDFKADYNQFGEQGTSQLNLENLFTIQDNKIYLREDYTRLFFHHTARQRISGILTHLISEILADMAEYKWMHYHPEQPESLPSSSVFRNKPAKLDLSLVDLDFLYRQAFQPLLEIQKDNPSLDQELFNQLITNENLTPSKTLDHSFKQAFAKLQIIFLEEYVKTYQGNLEGKVYREIATDLMNLQTVINQLYLTNNSQKIAGQPDLLLLFIACYYQGDKITSFHQLSQALSRYFLGD